MTVIPTLETFLFTMLGAFLMWLGRSLWKWWSESTDARRARVDRAAKTELRNRLLTESLHEHRNLMLKSGQWTRDTLPPFIRSDSGDDF